MLKVSITEDRANKTLYLIAEGHANTDEYGKDLVCASASILLYTLAQHTTFMYKAHKLKKRPHITCNAGAGKVVAKAKNEQAYAELLDAYLVISTGYALLAHNYPDNVEIVKELGTE